METAGLYPVSIKTDGCKDITFVEDFRVPFISHVCLGCFDSVKSLSLFVAPKAKEATPNFFPEIRQKTLKKMGKLSRAAKKNTCHTSLIDQTNFLVEYI